MKKSTLEVISYIFVGLAILCLVAFAAFGYRSDFSVNLPAWRIHTAAACGIGCFVSLVGFIAFQMIAD